MRLGGFGVLLLVVLAANIAAAVGLPLRHDLIQRASAQRAAAGSIVALPGLTRVLLPPVTSEESERAIRSISLPADLNPHLAASARRGQKALAPSLPPSIVELARALKNDVDLIYEFVRNNIDYYPTWGAQKGTVGALLDNQGTAFDQATLMVALLRQAGYTANFVKGRIALTGADVGSWLGVSTANACAVADLFTAGRIFVAQISSVDGSCNTALTGIQQIDHMWVKVNIGGTDYFFDPSLKPHSIKGGIDLAAATGYNAATYMNSATAGATLTADYIQNVNRANVRANLTTLGTALAKYVRTILPAGELTDLVGGTSITPYAGPALRQTSLPYQNTSSPITEFADVPDIYKTTLRVQYAGIDKTFTSDALGGTRLTITYDGTNHAVLAVDGTVVGTSAAALTPGTKGNVDLAITHNAYGNPGADAAVTQRITVGGSYLIGNAWGPASRGPVDFHSKGLKNARVDGAADTSDVVRGSTLAVLAATWLAQAHWSSRIIDRLGATTTTFHHDVGIAGYDKAGYVDLPASLVSITSQSQQVPREDAVFFMQATHDSIFESTAVEQTTGVSAVSAIKLLDVANSAGHKIFNATSSNFNGVVAPGLVTCSASQLASFASATAAGRRLILPQHCDLKENDWTGSGYLDINQDQSSIGLLISGNLAGGFASVNQPQLIMMGETLAYINLHPLTAELRGDTSDEPVDLPSGNYLHRHADIKTGIGDYPQSLEFSRLYSSGGRASSGSLGYGWSHEFATSIGVSSDGLQGMGEDSALDAVAAVAEMMVSFDLMLDPLKPLDKMVVAAIGQRWFGDQLIRNIVTVTQGLKSELFVRLPDATYNPPPGNSTRLIRNADSTFSLESANKAKINFDASGRLATHVYPNGLQVNFGYTGNDLTQVSNSLGRTLTLTVSGGKINSVSDGTRSVSYGYDGGGNLSTFTDATSATTIFQYDLTGRMTRITYPTNTVYVSNTYDTLDRVKSQTYANGKVGNFYLAGSRVEVVSADGSSIVTYHDGLGKVVKSIDALGRSIVNTYDGQSRLVKTVRPEGNGNEFDYDDAPCLVQARCTHNLKTMRIVPKPGSGQSNLTVGYTWESAFNRQASVIDVGGNATAYTYNAQGDIAQIQQPQDANGTRPTVSFTYSSFGPVGAFPAFNLLTTSSVLVAAGDTLDTTITYDALNHFAPRTKTSDAGVGKLNLTTTMTYDAVGNLVQVDGPRTDVSDLTTLTHDAQRRVTQVTDPLNRSIRVAYDADGLPLREATQIGSQWMVKCRAYTTSGQLSLQWGPAITASDASCPQGSAPVAVIDYTYDDLDRPLTTTRHLTTAQGGDRVSQIAYALDGRVLTVRTAVGSAMAQTERTYTYTANGLVASLTDANNNRTNYVYDGFDRKLKTFFPDKTNPGTSSATDFEQYAYDAIGNVTSIRKRSGQVITFAYDKLNRQTSRNYPNAEDNVNFTYDLVGRMLSASHVNGSYNVAFVWDHRDRLTSTTAGGRTLTHLYDEAGNRVRTTWPEATPFFVTTDYDALNRVVAIKEMGGTPALANYAYDDLSRRTAVTLGNGTTTTYSYDTQGNPASIKHDLAGATNDVTLSFVRNQAQEIVGFNADNPAYDWDGASVGTTAYNANGLNQYTNVGGSAQTYDGSGNLTGAGAWSYAFDADNRLRSVNGPTAAMLAWDAADRLRQTTVAGVTTQLLYDQAFLIGEYDGSGALLRRYVHGPNIDEPIVKYEGAGTSSKSWYYANQQGSVVASADGAGNPTATYTYGPFGEFGSTSPSRFGYTGQQFLRGLDLYHYRARMFSPTVGRFLQTDSVGFSMGMNLYSYVSNDPINYFDPSGLTTVQFGFAGGGVGAGVSGAFSVGIVIDFHGNVGIYGTGGYGVSRGLKGDVGGTFQISNGDEIWDISGEAKNGSVGLGNRLGVTGDVFTGSGQHGQTVTGGGITGPFTVGVGGAYGFSYTQVCGANFRCAGPLTDLGLFDALQWTARSLGSKLLTPLMGLLEKEVSELVKPFGTFVMNSRVGGAFGDLLRGAEKYLQDPPRKKPK